MKFRPGVMLLVIACMGNSSCSQRQEETSPVRASSAGMLPGYAMDSPDHVAVLPDILVEASGVTDVSPTEVAIVQDELGTIFLYDIDAGKVTKKIPFGPPGDYEGITRVDDAMFVLKSNGNLYAVRDWQNAANTSKHVLQLPTMDNEGLAFDPVENTLLVAPKSRWKKGASGKSERPIFAVDIASGHLVPEPVLVLNSDDLITFAKAHNLDIPVKTNKKGEEKADLRFKPASLAVHPVTHEIFVVSAVDGVLASFNRKGAVTGLQFLNKNDLPKAEGLTFLPDASLVIVSEAANDKPRIQVYKWDSSAGVALP
jgi:uncharacterized protein YjiK